MKKIFKLTTLALALSTASLQAFTLEGTVFEKVGKQTNVDPVLLYSVALTESALSNGGKQIAPNPYTLRTLSTPYYFKTKDEALSKLKQLADNHKSIDVGLMQINIKYHADKFKDFEQLLDIEENVRIGAEILKEVMASSPSTIIGIGRYHSYTPERADYYGRKVLAVAKQVRKIQAETKAEEDALKQQLATSRDTDQSVTLQPKAVEEVKDVAVKDGKETKDEVKSFAGETNTPTKDDVIITDSEIKSFAGETIEPKTELKDNKVIDDKAVDETATIEEVKPTTDEVIKVEEVVTPTEAIEKTDVVTPSDTIEELKTLEPVAAVEETKTTEPTAEEVKEVEPTTEPVVSEEVKPVETVTVEKTPITETTPPTLTQEPKEEVDNTQAVEPVEPMPTPSVIEEKIEDVKKDEVNPIENEVFKTKENKDNSTDEITPVDKTIIINVPNSKTSLNVPTDDVTNVNFEQRKLANNEIRPEPLGLATSDDINDVRPLGLATSDDTDNVIKAREPLIKEPADFFRGIEPSKKKFEDDTPTGINIPETKMDINNLSKLNLSPEDKAQVDKIVNALKSTGVISDEQINASRQNALIEQGKKLSDGLIKPPKGIEEVRNKLNGIMQRQDDFNNAFENIK